MLVAAVTILKAAIGGKGGAGAMGFSRGVDLLSVRLFTQSIVLLGEFFDGLNTARFHDVDDVFRELELRLIVLNVLLHELGVVYHIELLSLNLFIFRGAS